MSDTGLLEVARRCSSLTALDLSRSELPFKVGDVTLLVSRTSVVVVVVVVAVVVVAVVVVVVAYRARSSPSKSATLPCW